MIDLNHGSLSMTVGERITAQIDIGLAQAAEREPRRGYLGASMLGHACLRRVQYEYEGAPRKPFDGRTLRIFGLGHLFEELAIKWLRGAGFDLRTRKPDGQQFGFSVADGRIRGHVDGVFVGGPDFLKYPAVWECKSLNSKSWSDLAKRGVAASKPVYAAQIALNQGYLELHEHPALLTAVNKDTGELHHELVPYDADLAQRTSDRAVQVLRESEAGFRLPRMAASADHFECRYCDFHETCWSDA